MDSTNNVTNIKLDLVDKLILTGSTTVCEKIIDYLKANPDITSVTKVIEIIEETKQDLEKIIEKI